MAEDLAIINDQRKRKHRRAKKNKLHIEFDENARTEYLTGFSKRKNERRKKAKEDIKAILKEEKKRIQHVKAERYAERVREFETLSSAADKAAASETVELPNHTVTITQLSDVDFIGGAGFMLGTNQGLRDDSASEEDETNETGQPTNATNHGSSATRKRKHAIGGASGKMIKHNKHKNFSHAAHKHRRLDKSSRMKQQKKIKKNKR